MSVDPSVRVALASLARELGDGSSLPPTVQGRLVAAIGLLRDECTRNGNQNFGDIHRAAADYLRRELDGDARGGPLADALAVVASGDTNAYRGDPAPIDLLESAVVDHCRRNRDIVAIDTGRSVDRRIRTFDRPLDASASPFWWPLPRNWDPRVCEAVVAECLGREGIGVVGLRELLVSGASPDSPEDVNSRRTPLTHAVICRELALVELLVECGADPNLCDLDGEYPLTLAISRYPASLEVMKYLLLHGADVSLRDGEGLTILSRVARLWKLIEALIDEGPAFDPCVRMGSSHSVWGFWAKFRPSLCQRYLARHGDPRCGESRE